MDEITKKMIKDYLRVLLKKDFDVEIIDGTVVLSIPERFHIYVLDKGLQLIGVFESSDLEWFRCLNRVKSQIYRIQHRSMKDE